MSNRMGLDVIVGHLKSPSIQTRYASGVAYIGLGVATAFAERR